MHLPARLLPALLASALCPVLNAQLYVPPDHKGEGPHPVTCWFRNEGQIGTDQGDLAQDVHYQSYGQAMCTFLGKENTITFTVPVVHRDTTIADSLYAWSMQLTGEDVDHNVVPEEAEQVPWTHNYFKPWCPNGVIGVPGFRRIVYRNVYPGIDMHLYSNIWGYKLYFVVAPGADPQDIMLRFQGHDSLGVDPASALRIWINGFGAHFPQAMAYQHIGNTTVQVPWTPTYEEVQQDLNVKLGIGAYDNTYPLIFDISAGFGMPPPPPPPATEIPEWATFSGAHLPGSGFMRRTVPLANDGMASCGETMSAAFPTDLGFDLDYNGDVDGFYTVFDDQYHMSSSSYFGSMQYDYIAGITPYNGGFAVVGVTEGADEVVWQGPAGAYMDNTGTAGNRNCFVAHFSSIGQGIWRTLFGPEDPTLGLVPANIATYQVGAGQGLAIGGTIEWPDPSGMPLPIELSCLSPTLNALPICGSGAAYVQPAMGYHVTPFPGFPWTDGFFAKWDDQLQLVWSTIFGGSSYLDRINDLTVDPITNRLVAVGHSNSPFGGPLCQAPPPFTTGYPLCNAGGGGGTYFQSLVLPNPITFLGEEVTTVVEFGIDNALVWSTAFGPRTGPSGGVAIDARHNKIAITGWTLANAYGTVACAPSTGAEFPVCNALIPYSGPVNPTQTSYVAVFNSSNHDLLWSSFVPECQLEDVAIGPDNTILVAGGAGPTDTPPLQANTDIFSDQSLDEGGYIAGFDPSGLFFGGRYLGADMDFLNNVSVTGFFDLNRVYVGGYTHSDHWAEQFPYFCPPTVDPFCNSYLPEPQDLFWAQLKRHIVNIGVQEGGNAGPSPGFVLYPNPNNGELSIACSGSGCDRVRSLALYDASGRLVTELPVRLGSALALGEQAAGAYVARLRDAAGHVLGTCRVIIRP